MRKYREALEKMGISAYKAANDLGCTRQYLSRVLAGKVGAGSGFEKRWTGAFGELPEDDGVISERASSEYGRSATPKVIIKEVSQEDIDMCIAMMSPGVEDRIKKAFSGKPMPKSVEELASLMAGSWKTGVIDFGKFFAASQEKK